MLSSKLIWLKRFCARFGVIAIMFAGCWQIGSAGYIQGKAHLAQFLLNLAWSQTLQGETKVKPWGWADTYPVARLTFNKQQDDYIVLAGGTGRTMAFGPGHVSSTPLPGNGSNSVMVGHRDTHFSGLKYLKLGDEIHVETTKQKMRYKVVDAFIVDHKQSEVMGDFGVDLLTLITCYPFDALHAGGPLRYVVQAEPTPY